MKVRQAPLTRRLTQLSNADGLALVARGGADWDSVRDRQVVGAVWDLDVDAVESEPKYQGEDEKRQTANHRGEQYFEDRHIS